MIRQRATGLRKWLFIPEAGGALGSAFIPTFTGLLAHDQRERAWKLASSVANLLILVLTGVSLLAFIFAPQVVRYGLYVLNPGESAGQEQLTVELLRIMLPTVVSLG
jgi:putative peptidoglycan lipid II flippase